MESYVQLWAPQRKRGTVILSSEGHRDDLVAGVPVMGREAVRPGTRRGALSMRVWEKKQMKSDSSQCL